MSFPRVALLAVAVILLSACGGSAAQSTLASTPPSGSPRGAAGATCTNGARSVCITRAADGRTVTVGLGWTVGVDLRAQALRWSAPSELAPRLLRQVGSVVRADDGVQVDYTAVAAGHTTLRATERPICGPGRACPQFIVLWQVHVRVNGR
jgi:hypothetical protein